MPKIIGILTRHYSKRELNGNVYEFASYTDTETGETIEFTCDDVKGICYALKTIVDEPNKDGLEVFFQEVEHGKRALFGMMKRMPHAGSSGTDGAKYIINKLNP